MDQGIQKKELRKLLGAQVQTLSPADKEWKSHQICRAITRMQGFIQGRHILLYASLPDEVRTDEFLITLWRQKEKKVILPKVETNTGQLRLYAVQTASELLHGAFGVREPMPQVCASVDPQVVDMVIVPGRGFDNQGHRLGRGKAYYDKLLALLRPDAIVVGIFFECQKADCVPVEPHDRKLHFAVTEERVYEFDR